MPGSVINAGPAGTYPGLPIYGFAETRDFLAYENEYASGDAQRRVVPDTSRHAWNFRHRLTGAQFADWQTFWEAHGLDVPFYFGAFTDQAVYVARFAGVPTVKVAWADRVEVEVQLIQLA